MADTPRDLLRSRPAATAVDEKLDDWAGDRIREKWRDGARYGGGNSANGRPPSWRASRVTDWRCIVTGVSVWVRRQSGSCWCSLWRIQKVAGGPAVESREVGAYRVHSIVQSIRQLSWYILRTKCQHILSGYHSKTNIPLNQLNRNTMYVE